MARLARPALDWAARAFGVEARVLDAGRLREGGGPWLLRVERAGGLTAAVLRVGRARSARSRDLLATEADALRVAEDHRLAAPRLVALDLDGTTAGVPLLLVTALPGTSRIPRVPPVGRLAALGAAAAGLHAVAVEPRPCLPRRTRPVALGQFAGERESGGTPPLLRTAQERLARSPVPEAATAFVHGDLWQGNTLWVGDTLAGIVDWDCAGVGHPGLDLGSLRCDAAVLYGPRTAEEVLAGWRAAAGREPDDLAYWDVVAALCTPTDMAGWLAVVRDQGRDDLDPPTLQARRDAFLRAALHRLDGR